MSGIRRPKQTYGLLPFVLTLLLLLLLLFVSQSGEEKKEEGE